MRVELLVSLLLAGCVGLPDQYHVFGTWDDGSDIDGWHGNLSNGESYGVMVGVSGPIFREEAIEVHERTRHEVEDLTPDSPVPEPPPKSWWKDTSFLGWVEKLALGIVVLLTGRHGEDVVRKGVAKVKELRKDKTTPAP
jgi:hypothetical protein